MTPKPTCETCLFAVTENANHVCRRHPPTATVLVVPKQDSLGRMAASTQIVSVFPPVQRQQWCGEHQEAPSSLVLS